jgi:DNA-binding CsgD family transcriptional regulator
LAKVRAMQRDPSADSLLARLTDNEKECLRRRLLPQTAKEMAFDLGISVHAVEKRLKMARIKLGVTSSLVAARRLAVSEPQYQSTIPHIPDIPDEERRHHGDRAALPLAEAQPRHSLAKGSAMIVALLMIVLTAQDMPTPERLPPRSLDPAKVVQMADIPARKVGMEEAAEFLKPGFRDKDVNRSGYLEKWEVSAMEPRDKYRDPSLPAAPANGQFDPAAERKWTQLMDTNRDDKVSEAEYISYLMPWTLLSGVPADWTPTR